MSGVAAAQDACSAEIVALPRQRFVDPDPWREIAYASELDARRGIATMLARPLGGLPDEDLTFIAALVGHTLDKTEIRAAIRERFQPSPKGAPPC